MPGSPTPAPPTPVPSSDVFRVMNTSETLPDGVWFRRSAQTADTRRVTGHGVYMNDQVEVHCYIFGESVGHYNNRLWYHVSNVTRPTVAVDGTVNAGYLSAHYINDGTVANEVVPGVPACAPATHPAQRQEPFGHYDDASSSEPGRIRVTGWAIDNDDPTAPVRVHAYVGGRAGSAGAEGHDLSLANVIRPDVGAAHVGAGDQHGFDASFTTTKTGVQDVCVYAIDRDGGNNPLLGCKTVSIAAPASPGGSAPPDGLDRTIASAPARAHGVTRFAGPDRFSTAAATSRGSFPGTANDVFIVTGNNWPDALSAGSAAAKVNGPVLPVHAGSVPAVISQELDRLKPRRAWIIGGPGVVNSSVAADLRSRGVEVVRISGTDRYATAAMVAARFFPNAVGAYYASGMKYADALAGGAAAAHRDWPLLLTTSTAVPSVTPLVGNERIVLGGPAAVSEGVLMQLGARRVAGVDRYGTAAAIARDAFATAEVAYLATGSNFPDALAGAPAAARDSAPLLLAAQGCVTTATKHALVELGVKSRVVLGDTAVVAGSAADLTTC